MRKIPTLFKRDKDNPQFVIDELSDHPEVQRIYANKESITVTEKVDGACCAFIGGRLYARRELKRNKKPPVGFVAAQSADPVTGKTPGWVPVLRDDPNFKWFIEAALTTFPKATFDPNDRLVCKQTNCVTLEAIGPHFQGNPYDMISDRLHEHGSHVIDSPSSSVRCNFPNSLDFQEIKEWLSAHPYEGVVIEYFQAMAKIKRRDFGMPWPIKGSRLGRDNLFFWEIDSRATQS